MGAAKYTHRTPFSRLIETLESRRLLSVSHPADESSAEASDSAVSSESEHAAPVAAPAKTSPTVATESSDSSEASDSSASSTPAVSQLSISRATRTANANSQSEGASGGSNSSASADTGSSNSSSDAQAGQTTDSSSAPNSPGSGASDQQSPANQTDNAAASATKPPSPRPVQPATIAEPVAAIPLREARPIALAGKLPSLIGALRIAVEPKVAPIEIALTAQPLQAVAGVAQMASDAASAVEAVVQVLPQIGQMAIPRLLPLNALSGFADAISSFAHESAALGTALVSGGNHKLAWAVTFSVLAADAILVGRWRINRRRQQAAAAEVCRPVFSLRRVKR